MTPLHLALRDDAILDQWAARRAARDIAADLALGSIKSLYRVVAEARAMHDPRALYRAGRESQGRPSLDRKEATRTAQRRLRRPVDGAPVRGFWFGRQTVYVTTLGTGSADCRRVPVTLSCVLPQ